MTVESKFDPKDMVGFAVVLLSNSSIDYRNVAR